jgi:hypothetical protein
VQGASGPESLLHTRERRSTFPLGIAPEPDTIVITLRSTGMFPDGVSTDLDQMEPLLVAYTQFSGGIRFRMRVFRFCLVNVMMASSFHGHFMLLCENQLPGRSLELAFE